jgi:hypothetical protein
MGPQVETVSGSVATTTGGVTDVPQADPFSKLKKGEKFILLAIFTLAQFLGTAINSMARFHYLLLTLYFLDCDADSLLLYSCSPQCRKFRSTWG